MHQQVCRCDARREGAGTGRAVAFGAAIGMRRGVEIGRPDGRRILSRPIIVLRACPVGAGAVPKMRASVAVSVRWMPSSDADSGFSSSASRVRNCADRRIEQRDLCREQVAKQPGDAPVTSTRGRPIVASARPDAG